MVMEQNKMSCPTTIGKYGIFKILENYVSTIPIVKYKKCYNV